MSTESKAREILGDEYRRTHDANPKCCMTEDVWGLALRAVERALAQPVVDEAMVERVAEALAWAHRDSDSDGMDSGLWWEYLSEQAPETSDYWLTLARAALTAAGMGVGCGRG